MPISLRAGTDKTPGKNGAAYAGHGFRLAATKFKKATSDK